MPDYKPTCNNCFKCPVCRGNGFVYETYMERGIAGKKKVECRHCQGVGGKPGAGKHDHR